VKANIVDFVNLLIKGTEYKAPELLVKFTTASPPVVDVKGVCALDEDTVKKLELSLVLRRKVLTFIERRKKAGTTK